MTSKQLEIKDLPIYFSLEILRKKLKLTQTEMMRAMGYDAGGLSQSYGKLKTKPFLLSEKLYVLKTNYPEVNLDFLIMKQGEPIIEEKEENNEKEILAALKVMIERNEERAIQIEALEKKVRDLMKRVK